MALVDWMGKMRMNRIFVHFNRLPPGDLSALLPELERRGILLELGGHNLPKLLPPDALQTSPELRRLRQGERRLDGNFCTANPRTLQLLAKGARGYVEQLPPARLYHFWPCDAREDPWCSCPACQSLSPCEQMWRAVAAASEGVAMARPEAGVSALLYHESLDGSKTAPDGFHALFAPRERCYLHFIGADCHRNRGYASHLKSAVEKIGERLSVLEYYADPILMGRPANRPALVASDLSAYRAAGVRSISALVFGSLSWWLYPLQLYSFAKGCWDPAVAERSAEEYCRAIAGENCCEPLATYYRLESEASGTHLRFCGYGRDGSWATLPFPPTAPLDEVQSHLAEMMRGQMLLRDASAALREAASRSSGQRGLLAQIIAAHKLEEAFHAAVVAEMARAPGRADGDPKSAFAAAADAVEQVEDEDRGLFGTHWMLSWLRRCANSGLGMPP